MTVEPTVVVAVIGALSAAIGRLVWLVYTDLRRDRDFWRDAYLKAVGHTDRAMELAAKAAPDA
jgi:hypothetical protein